MTCERGRIVTLADLEAELFDPEFIREANAEYARAKLAGVLHEALWWSDEDTEAP